MVVVSIFVNPLQFGADEDLDAYPRVLEDDLALLRGEGVEIAFTPSAVAMYPDGPRTTVSPRPTRIRARGLGPPRTFRRNADRGLQAAADRAPDRIFFGEKDYQQLVLVRQMVADLNIDVQVVGVPIVREDGWAGDVVAQPLPQAGRNASWPASCRRRCWPGRTPHRWRGWKRLRAAGSVLSEVPAIEVDYLEVRDCALGPAPVSGAGTPAGRRPARQDQAARQRRN